MCILQSDFISMQTSHISRARQVPVVSVYLKGQGSCRALLLKVWFLAHSLTAQICSMSFPPLLHWNLHFSKIHGEPSELWEGLSDDLKISFEETTHPPFQSYLCSTFPYRRLGKPSYHSWTKGRVQFSPYWNQWDIVGFFLVGRLSYLAENEGKTGQRRDTSVYSTTEQMTSPFSLELFFSDICFERERGGRKGRE